MSILAFQNCAARHIAGIMGAVWALTGCFTALVWQRRHHTVSAEKRSLTLKLFIAQFTNTALSTIVANMYIPVVYKRLQDTPFSSLLFQGTYGVCSLALWTRAACAYSLQTMCFVAVHHQHFTTTLLYLTPFPKIPTHRSPPTPLPSSSYPLFVHPA